MTPEEEHIAATKWESACRITDRLFDIVFSDWKVGPGETVVLGANTAFILRQIQELRWGKRPISDDNRFLPYPEDIRFKL